MLHKVEWTAAMVLAALAGAAAQTACTYSPSSEGPAAALAPNFGLFFLDEGPSAKLAYGQANSDNVGLMLQCAKGSRMVEVSDVVRTAPAPTLALASEGKRTEVKVDAREGLAVGKAPVSAPALSGFRKSGRMEVSYAGLRYAVAARPAEKASVERFFNACEGRA